MSDHAHFAADPGLMADLATDEPLIAVEMNNGDVVSVPIIWLMSQEAWTTVYSPNGQTKGRTDIDGTFFARSVRRVDIRRILG